MSNRNTMQKQIILDNIKKTRIHPTASELYEMIKKENPNIGQATVYRNLKTMAKNGDVIIIPCDNNINRYDGDTSFHDHFICEKCNKIIDVFEDKNSFYDNLEKKYEFQIKNESTIYKGICKNCIEKCNK